MSWLLFDSFGSSGSALPAPNAYARMLGALLPPGRALRVLDGTLLLKLLAACGDELARLEARVRDMLEEADPSTADELLPEYERELGLVAEGTPEERGARVVARTVARQRYRPADFQAVLAPLLGQEITEVIGLERTAAMAAAMGDVREIYRFFIYRDPTLPGAYYLAAAQALVDVIKPSHTTGQIIESVDFLCDDVYSLCDSDLVGA